MPTSCPWDVKKIMVVHMAAKNWPSPDRYHFLITCFLITLKTINHNKK